MEYRVIDADSHVNEPGDLLNMPRGFASPFRGSLATMRSPTKNVRSAGKSRSQGRER